MFLKQDVNDTAIVISTNEPVSSSDVEDIEVIDMKIKDLNEQLNYWKERRKKCERKQLTSSP